MHTWLQKTQVAYKNMQAASMQVKQTQEQILLRILTQNAHSEYGKRYDFATIKSIEAYQKRVPISEYSDIAHYIEQIAAGKPQVLCSEPIRLLEPTSGTTTEKLIPYTQSLQKEFNEALSCWLADILQNAPKALSGRQYWSVSPSLTTQRVSSGGLPIGFENDYNYLGISKQEASQLFCIPEQITTVQNTDDFWYATAFYLVAAHDLSMISVWSPGYLLKIVQTIIQHSQSLLTDLAEGTLSLPQNYGLPLIKDKKRALQLSFLPEWDALRIWPNLSLVSLWADAAAQMYMPEINRFFDTIYIQPKGLLATEGIVSLPLIHEKASVAAFTAHFLEFEDLKTNQIKALHELTLHNEYSVLLTTGGGLYRYKLHDRVEVSGFYNQAPLLIFKGRTATLDFAGEKLDEAFVTQCLYSVIADTISNFFVLFAPHIHPDASVQYMIYTENVLIPDVDQKLDTLLRTNFYYNHARENGQIRKLKQIVVANGYDKFMQHQQKKGIKLGNIKPLWVDKHTDWSLVFGIGPF